jgi:preprotein translocase subunit SecG
VIFALILGIHIIICCTLVIVVLLQAGKGGGLAGAFGGGGGAGQTLFGGRGAATFLSKATTVLGISFMTTSLVLALMSGGRGGPQSILREGPAPGTAPPPATSQPIQIPGAGDLPALGTTPGEEGGEEAAPVGQPAGDASGAGASQGTDQQTTPPGGN